jgi:hypothetical protein
MTKLNTYYSSVAQMQKNVVDQAAATIKGGEDMDLWLR